MNYWLMKTEPEDFSIDDLVKSKSKTTDWDGIRNYQAFHFMRDEMKRGDLALFYHSSCKKVGIVGIAKVVKEAHPDLSALDTNSKYFDKKATKEAPRWCMVSIKWCETFDDILTLPQLKENSKLSEMVLLKRGNRLSIMPVRFTEYKAIIKMANN
jgi:predicted RNA-binding protein with PUA-like domain